MDVIRDKKIILAITGSIAAYKSALLTRELIKAGATVKVVMTQAATEFITPLTMSTLSRNPVLQSLASEQGWSNHVDLGLWADAMLIAPCTANTMSRMAVGLANDMLVATYLSAKCPVFIAPAMDLDMWKHPTTSVNYRKLESFGNRIIPVEYGELASGLTGKGRMAEPETIMEFLCEHFGRLKSLEGRKFLITAGPTFESIDPIRYIGNHSTGTMGIALAEECRRRGAEVQLILGPSTVSINDNGMEVIRVRSADQMYTAAVDKYSDCDVAILAAAVADYTPENAATQKIKKSDERLILKLKRTRDIAAQLGKMKKQHQKNIGFALETENEESNARQKLARKNFDFIVLNSLNEEGAGFGLDTNRIAIIHNNQKIRHYPLNSKTKVAGDIVNEIVKLLEHDEN